MSKYKDDILELRKNGKSYDEIENELGCSRGVISYHCQKENLDDIGLDNKELSEKKKQAIREYYKDHTKEETSEKFGVSGSTVQKYGDPKKEKRSIKRNPGSSQHTKSVGDLTELKLITRLYELGYTVLEPYGENDRYDIVFEDKNNNFQRVQCKTPNLINSDTVLSVNACSVSGGETYTYHGQIDYFGLYSEETEKCYLIPFEEVKNCHTRFHVRLEDPKNKNSEVRMAENYEL